MKRTRLFKMLAMSILIAAAAMSSGCAFLRASIDVDAAISAAAVQNLANFRTATDDVANVHNRDSERLEALLDEKIVVAKDGVAALALLRDYRVKKVQLAEAKAADMMVYAKALNNASLIVELIGQRIALRARWSALIGRLPAIAQLKAIAHAESQAYINAISKPTR